MVRILIQVRSIFPDGTKHAVSKKPNAGAACPTFPIASAAIAPNP